MSDSKPYKALGRGFLIVDELPEGALPRYERDVQAKSYVMPRRGGIPGNVSVPDNDSMDRGSKHT